MDIKVVDESGQEITPDNTPMESKQIDGDVMTPLLQRAIGNVLGLEKDSEFGKRRN